MKKIYLYMIFILLMVACARSNSDDLINTGIDITNTPIPQITNTIILTPDPIENQTVEPDIAATLAALGPVKLFQHNLSPDGSIDIRIERIECQSLGELDVYSLEQLVLVETDTKKSERIYSQLISCGGLGEYGLKGLFWSENSRYFYFTNARQGYPDGCCQFYYRKPILRFDSKSGTVAILGMGDRPSEKDLLATWSSGDITIWDIEKGSEVHYPRLDNQLGIASMVWSPDGCVLAYLQVDSLITPNISRLSLIDTNKGAQTEISAEDFPVFIDLVWPKNDDLILNTPDGQLWSYSLSTDILKSGN